jgi:molybdopterin converting factor small subunit
MTVTVIVPSMLAAQAEGRRSFDIEAQTVGEALRSLPVADLLFNEHGELNRHLNVYLDGEDTRRLDGLEVPLEGAHEIRIVAMVSGG